MNIRDYDFVRRLAYEVRTHRRKLANLLRENTLQDTIRANLNDGDKKYIYLHWAESRNFGDWASFELTKILSSKKPLSTRSYYALRGQVGFSCIGSVLQWPERIPCEVWGAGFISASEKMLTKPKNIHSVRGPLTRQILLNNDIVCPPLYGDPAAILFKKYANKNIEKKYKIGLIPHYVDASDPAIEDMAKIEGVVVIDVFSDIKDIAYLCQQCEVIASSSLHGIIMADTYSVPNVWMSLSGVATKDGFKYSDYFSSVGREAELPLKRSHLSVKSIAKHAQLNRKMLDLKAVLAACPFSSDRGYEEVSAWLER